MELRDCTWCGSARSIENDLCQVCLMRFPTEDSIVLVLPEPPAETTAEPDERPAVGG